MSLTLKQQFFVKHYLLERNATKATIAAGYSEATAEAAGSRLLRNVKVQAEIQKCLSKIFERLDVSAEHILRELACVGFARMDEFIEVRGHNAFISMAKVDSDKAAAITELTSDVLINSTEKNGDGKEVAIQIKRTKIKLGGKLEALRMLAQYRKLLTNKVEHSGDGDSSPIRVLWIGNARRTHAAGDFPST